MRLNFIHFSKRRHLLTNNQIGFHDLNVLFKGKKHTFEPVKILITSIFSFFQDFFPWSLALFVL